MVNRRRTNARQKEYESNIYKTREHIKSEMKTYEYIKLMNDTDEYDILLIVYGDSVLHD